MCKIREVSSRVNNFEYQMTVFYDLISIEVVKRYEYLYFIQIILVVVFIHSCTVMKVNLSHIEIGFNG